jgi:HEAT repeat protein
MGAAILRCLVPQTLPIIEAMLVDPLPRARRVAASALTWGRSYQDRDSRERAEKHERISEVWSRLLHLLDDEDPDVRSEAVYAIQRLHPTSKLLAGSYAALLRRLAIEPNDGVRGVIIAALKWARIQQNARIDLEPVRAVLVSELNNKNCMARADLAFLLNNHLRGPDVAAAMIDRQADPHPDVRQWASSYLVREGDTSDLPRLCAALLDQLADYRHPYTQADAAESLAKVGDAGILPQLRAARENLLRGNSRWRDRPISQYIDDAIAAIESRAAQGGRSKAPAKKGRKRSN